MTNSVMARMIDGKKLAAERETILKEKVSSFVKKYHRKPSLLAIELSNDPGSVLYLKLKRAAAERIGIEMEVMEVSHQRPGLFWKGRAFINADGIFIQHPPRHDKQQWQKLVDRIPPGKDVDCLTSANLSLIKAGKPRFLPATVKAIGYCLIAALHLKRSDLSALKGPTLRGKRMIIFGRSPMVGLPLSWWFENLGADVRVVHSKTEISEQRTVSRRADILISTTGKPGIITGDMVKEGVIVIDSGSPKGDVDVASVMKKASAITPVPGGVGPLTVVSLMENVIEAAMLQYSHHADREGS